MKETDDKDKFLHEENKKREVVKWFLIEIVVHLYDSLSSYILVSFYFHSQIALRCNFFLFKTKTNLGSRTVPAILTLAFFLVDSPYFFFYIYASIL